MSSSIYARIAVLAALIFSSARDASGDAPATRPVDGTARIAPPFNWVTTPPIITAKADAQHPLNAIKDPSIVRYDGKWHVFASSVTKAGGYSLVYLSFADFKDANAAPQVPLDTNPNLVGYHCAPQVFYFEPQKLWYMVQVSQHPTFSTTSDITKPESWSKPQNFFAEQPKSVVEGWLDYWVICDDTRAYLFFTDDHGRFYRSRTTLADFPKGFDEPVVVMKEPIARDLFEGSCTYRIKGTTRYLTLIEAANEQWKRYYKAYIADSLDGEWRPLAAQWGNSFADVTRVRSDDGSPVWTQDISHGELIRDGYDQTMTIDPANLQLLYQGIDVNEPSVKGYNEIRWQLGLLRRDK